MTTHQQTQTWQQLQASLGYPFKNLALLQQACTHSTYTRAHPEAGDDYQRLEFLGDAVVALLVGQLLYDQDPTAREGTLSKRRAEAVCTAALAWAGEQLGLLSAIRFAKPLSAPSLASSQGILADVFEAVVGAVYLDGGFSAAKTCFKPILTAALQRTARNIDAKTALQELCHQRALPAPAYQILATEGPPHALTYRCEVAVASAGRAEGVAASKRGAQQEAAALLLERITNKIRVPNE